MRGNFEPSLARLNNTEGGYVNHPKDPGGATNRGVTQRVYNGYRKARRLPTRSVRSIEQNEVREIYKQQYWDAGRCDLLPAGIDYVHFDGCVNSGPGQAAMWLQRALMDLTGTRLVIDGIIGNATVGALARLPLARHDDLVDIMCDRRLAFMKALDTWKTFGKGWTNRVRDVRKIGQLWAGVANDELEPAVPNSAKDILVDTVLTISPDLVPLPDYHENADAPAVIADAIKRPTKSIGDVLAGIGSATAAIPILLDQAKDQLNPLAGLPSVGSIIGWLTAAGVAVAIVGIAVRTVQKTRETARADALDLPTHVPVAEPEAA